MGYKFVRFLVRIVVGLIARIEVEGMENLPQSGGYIAAANHAGRLEVILLFHLLQRNDIILIIAEKYRNNPFWRWFARQVDGIFIDRYQADFNALRQVLKRLSKGGVLAIAPEGTRSPTGTLIQARWGAAYLAAKSGDLIIPVGVTGTADRQVVNSLKHFKRVKVLAKAGGPISFPPLNKATREDQLEEYTDEIMCQIAALLPEEIRGYYAGFPRVQEIIEQNASKNSPGNSDDSSLNH